MTGQTGAAGYGLAASATYRAEGLAATLDLATAPRGDLTAGATIPEAMLRIDREGKDGIAVPLVGLVGCRT